MRLEVPRVIFDAVCRVQKKRCGHVRPVHELCQAIVGSCDHTSILTLGCVVPVALTDIFITPKSFCKAMIMGNI